MIQILFLSCANSMWHQQIFMQFFCKLFHFCFCNYNVFAIHIIDSSAVFRVRTTSSILVDHIHVSLQFFEISVSYSTAQFCQTIHRAALGQLFHAMLLSSVIEMYYNQGYHCQLESLRS